MSLVRVGYAVVTIRRHYRYGYGLTWGKHPYSSHITRQQRI